MLCLVVWYISIVITISNTYPSVQDDLAKLQKKKEEEKVGHHHIQLFSFLLCVVHLTN